MPQAYARLPLRPTVHKKRPRRVCNALLCNNVTGQDIMCTYVTSQLFFRRRFSQPPRAHHIPPAHSCSFLRSWSADFGSDSFVFGSVFSHLERGRKEVGTTQKRLHSKVKSSCIEWFFTALKPSPILLRCTYRQGSSRKFRTPVFHELLVK